MFNAKQVIWNAYPLPSIWMLCVPSPFYSPLYLLHAHEGHQSGLDHIDCPNYISVALIGGLFIKVHLMLA